MKLTPIDSPRIAQVLGAKTLTSEAARTSAMEAFNAPPITSVATPEPTTTGQSPSVPGAVLDPANVDPPLPESLTHEAPAAAAPDTDQEAARIASHYANLARKEKMLRMREARINQKLSQLTPTPTAPTPQFDPSKYVARDELISNPFGVLNNLGLSYEQLTQKALEAPSAEDMEQRRQISALQAKLDALESAQTKTAQSFEENQNAARKQAELQIKQDVIRLLNTDPTFEVTRANRAHNEVVKLITTVYDKGMGYDYPRGTILDASEATLMVENELTERALRVAKLQKIQSRLNSNKSAQKPQQTQAADTQNTLRTLTNSVGTSSRKLSARDRALAAFRGEVA